MLPLVLGLAIATTAPAPPPPPPPPPPLAGYLARAREANLGLARESLDVDLARARLAEARALRLPRLDASARYTVSTGGRTIDFPAGDLLNPVYDTLNRLVAAPGTQGPFPSIENQSIRLLRAREQDTRLSLVFPLYRPEIARGIEARAEDVASREARLAALRRDLDLEVRVAYFRWTQAEAAVAILEGARALVAENARVQRSLFRNDKVTEDAPLRAEAEQAAVDERAVAAGTDRDLARAFLNFLLDRPLDTPIEPTTPEAILVYEQALVAWIDAHAPGGVGPREELTALARAIDATDAGARAVRAQGRPTLALAVDVGLEGRGYSPATSTGFSQTSLVGAWALFDGGARAARVAQAEIDARRLRRQLDEARAQFDLQLTQARDAARAASAGVVAAEARVTAARRAYAIADRRQREGVLNFLAVLETRQELTDAELALAIRRVDRLVAAARLLRAAAVEVQP